MHLDPDSPAGIYRHLLEAIRRVQSPLATTADGQWSDFGQEALKETVSLYEQLKASTGTTMADAIALYNAGGHLTTFFMTEALNGNIDWNLMARAQQILSAGFRTLHKMAGPEWDDIVAQLTPPGEAPQPQPHIGPH